MEIQDKRRLEEEEKVRRREEEGEDVRTGTFQRREGETERGRRMHKCKDNQFNWLPIDQLRRSRIDGLSA